MLRLGAIRKVLWAIGSTLSALWTRLVLDPYLGDHLPYTTFFVAIAITVIYAGVWPALLAVGISAVAANWFFISPRYTLALSSSVDQIGYLTFFVASLTLIAFGHAFDKTRDRAAKVMEELRSSRTELKELAGRLEHIVEERTRELTQSQDRLRALAAELNLAEQRERNRLASDLHDHLAQMLVLAKMKLSQARRGPWVLPKGEELLTDVDDALAQSLTYTRTLVANLAPPALRDFGLLAGLRWLTEQMRYQGLVVSLHTSVERLKLPEDQVILLFQSIRELLINVTKHAQANQAAVTLDHQMSTLRIEVRDNGVGFDPAAVTPDTSEQLPRFGLFSIRERMLALGGTFEVESKAGCGTTARLTLPMTSNV
jgi:signal transduction histidine kinase